MPCWSARCCSPARCWSITRESGVPGCCCGCPVTCGTLVCVSAIGGLASWLVAIANDEPSAIVAAAIGVSMNRVFIDVSN
jgi:hypothetical protein